jgi:tRNA(Ile2) C34 agmatinyltransferase TiaS
MSIAVLKGKFSRIRFYRFMRKARIGWRRFWAYRIWRPICLLLGHEMESDGDWSWYGYTCRRCRLTQILGRSKRRYEVKS